MIRIWLDRKRLALAIRIDQLDRNEVSVRHRMSVGNGEWIFEDGFDGTPDL